LFSVGRIAGFRLWRLPDAHRIPAASLRRLLARAL
jgi:hypothetical protein